MGCSAQKYFLEKWKTIDDRTGNPQGYISIYEERRLLYRPVVRDSSRKVGKMPFAEM